MVRAHNLAYSKLPVRTGFTSENPNGEAMLLHQKKREQQQIVKSLLQSQIDHKKNLKSIEK